MIIHVTEGPVIVTGPFDAVGSMELACISDFMRYDV